MKEFSEIVIEVTIVLACFGINVYLGVIVLFLAILLRIWKNGIVYRKKTLKNQEDIIVINREIYNELVKLNVSMEHLINSKVNENGTKNKE